MQGMHEDPEVVSLQTSALDKPELRCGWCLGLAASQGQIAVGASQGQIAVATSQGQIAIGHILVAALACSVYSQWLLQPHRARLL